MPFLFLRLPPFPLKSTHQPLLCQLLARRVCVCILLGVLNSSAFRHLLQLVPRGVGFVTAR